MHVWLSTAKPAEPLPFEHCENGAKATAWEPTRRRVGPDVVSERMLPDDPEQLIFDNSGRASLEAGVVPRRVV